MLDARLKNLFCKQYFFSDFTELVGIGSFFQFLNLYTQSIGLPGRVISRRKAATYTQDNKNTE
jgi:hypothetical protein